MHEHSFQPAESHSSSPQVTPPDQGSLERCVSGIAHDLSNLLSMICGIASLASRNASPGSRERSDLDHIAEVARRAGDMTRHLQEVGRRRSRRHLALDLSQAVRDKAEIYERVVGDSIALRLDLSPVPVTVAMASEELDRVLINLLRNARDAMPSGGEIRLVTQTRHAPQELPSPAVPPSPGRWALLQVTDSGAGMDEATRRRVFEPYFTTRHGVGGTGLGLSSVKDIVDECGGQVVVESETGAGTTIAVLLPQLDP